MRFRRLRQKPLYLVLLLVSLLSLSTTSSAPQEFDISFNHDLIYLDVRTNSLMILPSGKDEPEILVGSSSDSTVEIAGKVLAYHASENGRELALVADIPFEYGVFWLDVLTRELLQVASTKSFPEAKISPNGKWLTYREEESEEIFAIDLDKPGEKIIVGTCEEAETDLRTIGCGSFHWSPNSAQMVWSDGRGLWITQPPAYEKKVLNNYLLRRSEEGDSVVGYGISSWSPNSRYLVLRRLARIEGIVSMLLDVQNGHLVELPNTFQYGTTKPVHITWLENSLFSVVSGGSGGFDKPANVDIWQVDPMKPDLLVPESQFFIGVSCTIINAVGLYDNNKVFYLMYDLEFEGCKMELDFGLYFGTLPGSYLSLLVEFPEYKSDYVEFTWSPDNEFAVLSLKNHSNGGSSYVDLLDMEGSKVEDLTPIIGNAEDVCCFTWVE